MTHPNNSQWVVGFLLPVLDITGCQSTAPCIQHCKSLNKYTLKLDLFLCFSTLLQESVIILQEELTLVAASTAEPLSSSSWTRSMCPSLAAKCRALSPFCNEKKQNNQQPSAKKQLQHRKRTRFSVYLLIHFTMCFLTSKTVLHYYTQGGWYKYQSR